MLCNFLYKTNVEVMSREWRRTEFVNVKTLGSAKVFISEYRDNGGTLAEVTHITEPNQSNHIHDVHRLED